MKVEDFLYKCSRFGGKISVALNNTVGNATFIGSGAYLAAARAIGKHHRSGCVAQVKSHSPSRTQTPFFPFVTRQLSHSPPVIWLNFHTQVKQHSRDWYCPACFNETLLYNIHDSCPKCSQQRPTSLSDAAKIAALHLERYSPTHPFLPYVAPHFSHISPCILFLEDASRGPCTSADHCWCAADAADAPSAVAAAAAAATAAAAAAIAAAIAAAVAAAAAAAAAAAIVATASTVAAAIALAATAAAAAAAAVAAASSAAAAAAAAAACCAATEA